jgi:thiamine-monophosphate kinase
MAAASASEFEIIRRHFAAATDARDDVELGIGDDCALLKPAADECLAVSIDTLVAGRHFLPEADSESLGHKALAVNLSDLAAMGARPAWATLALTLPNADEGWLEGFMTGFSRLARLHRVQLVGGDTTRGPLSVTVQVHGFIASAEALRRDRGRPGDWLYVSGSVGDAALALRLQEAREPVPDALRTRLDRPEPRIELGRLLAGRARAAIDVSDGLAADLGHLCKASAVGARIDLARLPLSPAVAASVAAGDWSLPLAGGDDYELLFSVEPAAVNGLLADCRAAGHRVTEIGRLVTGEGIELGYPDGRYSREVPGGFDHFRA